MNEKSFEEVWERVDLDRVEKVARNELASIRPGPRLGDEPAAALARWYAHIYLDGQTNQETFGRDIAAAALEDCPADIGGDEAAYRIGSAVARVCTEQADAELAVVDLSIEHNFRAALARTRHAIALAGVPADRALLAGVDMRRHITSEQSVTPADIREIAADMEPIDGNTPNELLDYEDYEIIAEGFMTSLGGIELDYADIEDIESRIEDVAEQRAEELRETGSRALGIDEDREERSRHERRC